jgi:23S rRNA (cytidine2498-2'-O)-methyltransferase
MQNLVIVTMDPDFVDLGLDEIKSGSTGPVDVQDALEPGVYPLQLSTSFWNLAQKWQAHSPIFVRHIFPVQLTVNMPTLENLKQQTELVFADLVDPAFPFSVQTRIFGDWPFKPFDVNTKLATLLCESSGAELDVRRPRQIVSVVIARRPENEGIAFLGLSLTEHNLSDWAGGVRRFKREKGQISRAEFKLLEALEQFQITLPPRGVALDLGAAPGGWTRILRLKEQYVTAVDPAGLHPSLRHDPVVRHIRQSAEAHLDSAPDKYDLIVNDMRMDARDSARLMVQYRPYLYATGEAIMTLKLPAGNRPKIIDHSFKILRQGYQIQKARHLFHNRSEITLHLRPGGVQTGK